MPSLLRDIAQVRTLHRVAHQHRMGDPGDRARSLGRLVAGLGVGLAADVIGEADQQIAHIDPGAMEEKQPVHHEHRAEKSQGCL
jgi:hypothetical protein